MNQAAQHILVKEELENFAFEIDKSLSAESKHISSKFFYDKKGDELFTQIMELDEYYLTRSEFEIFDKKKEEIFNSIPFKSGEFDLVELGSGDGLKTKILIDCIYQHNQHFNYLPIDISQNSLNLLHKSLAEFFPLTIKTFNFQYLEGLREVYRVSGEHPKLILFLGSNIGNLTPDEAGKFLNTLASIKNPDDLLLIGIDLKKDPAKILAAYNDATGITASFNLNVLHRINKELQADFKLTNFAHYPVYDPRSGSAKSFLISKVAQTVHVGYLNKSFQFEKNEEIFTEISQKYSKSGFTSLAKRSGLDLLTVFTDANDNFASYLLQ